MDPFIVFVTYKFAETSMPGYGWYATVAQLIFLLVTKVVKLVGLFMREPSDLIFLPVSILFGYFHGLIKLWALCTLRMVCTSTFIATNAHADSLQTSWGSRPDGDANDSHRMSPRARRSESITLPPGHHPTLLRYKDEKSYPVAVEVGRESDKVYPNDTKPEADNRSALLE